jgi:predicted benzoate:H+ symporter BenE
MLENYFKPTPKSLLKISLALRGMVATISGAAYFQNNIKAAFWFMVAGAVVDFLIQCLDPGTEKQAN